MFSKTDIKNFKRTAARKATFFSLWLHEVLPYWLVKLFVWPCFFVWYWIAKRLRKVARETLTVAFAEEKTPQEVQQIVRSCFANVGKSMMDLIYYCKYPADVLKVFSAEGKEHLDEALKQGHGVVAVTAHFGNFPLMMLYFAQSGYKVNVILRRARDEEIAKRILEIMGGVKVNTIYSIPARESAQKSLRALRNNEILFVLLDQNFGSDSGVFVEFFGRQAATATGPVVLADRTKAAIVPLFTIREGNRYRVMIEPAVEMEQRENKEEMIVANVAKITRIIERYIRKYPAEWGWMHRRWKTKFEEQSGL